MKVSLLPREKIFYALLEKLAVKAEEAVKLFKVLIDSWNSSHAGIQGLKDLEHECDQIVHEIMVKLNKLPHFAIPKWVMFLCAFVMAVGTLVGGWRIVTAPLHKCEGF